MVDLTERKRGERERELLARELNHRVKNILAVVQSLAMQTDHSRSVEEFRDNFVGRLSALARAHSLLLDARVARRGSQGAGRAALQAYRGDHPDTIEIDGEPVPLTASQSLGLSLILHELGTNAAKYGALAHAGGTGTCVMAGRGAASKAGACVCAGRSAAGLQVEPPGREGLRHAADRAGVHLRIGR